jgi:two-component system chemotaxis sensor kinase CheA
MKNVKGMGGRVQIKSVAGKGSSFIIRLPLTMAILDGLTVRVGAQVFIIPLNVIIESLQPKPEEVSTVSGKGELINIRGEYFPMIRLHSLFNIPDSLTRPEQAILSLVEAEGEKFVLMIDELVGQQQVVIKSLESNYKKVEGTAGGTILGDGRVALILDMGSLLTLARNSGVQVAA